MNRLLKWLYTKLLAKQLKGNSRLSKVVNVENTGTIGILFDASSEVDRQTILRYAENWKKAGKKVLLLGFVKDKSDTSSLGFPAFNLKQLDWLKRPKCTAVDQFLKAPIDLLLIPVPHKPPHPICHLAAIHPAPFKAGTNAKETQPYLDLMIDTGEKQDLPFLLKQINVYLNLVNTNTKREVPPKQMGKSQKLH